MAGCGGPSGRRPPSGACSLFDGRGGYQNTVVIAPSTRRTLARVSASKPTRLIESDVVRPSRDAAADITVARASRRPWASATSGRRPNTTQRRATLATTLPQPPVPHPAKETLCRITDTLPSDQLYYTTATSDLTDYLTMRYHTKIFPRPHDFTTAVSAIFCVACRLLAPLLRGSVTSPDVLLDQRDTINHNSGDKQCVP